MQRRAFLRLSAASLLAGACRAEPHSETRTVSRPTDDPARMPTLFVSHGAPTLALDEVSGRDFRRAAEALPAPRAIVALSAHWLDAPATIGTRQRRPLLYDFGGFSRELYEVQYDAPAAASLADRLQALAPDLRRDDERPWDHGVWVPLLHMYPAADVPIVQVSVPYAWSPQRLFELGQRLQPLRDEGVLVFGSGGAVHNLRAVDWRDDAPPPAWATDFEAWLRDRLDAGAVDDVVAFRERAPALRHAHPTDEHFLPLLMALGAAADDPVRYPIEGFELGSLSRLAVRFGSGT